MKRRRQKSKRPTPKEPKLFRVITQDFVGSLGILFPGLSIFLWVLQSVFGITLSRRATVVEPDGFVRSFLIVSFIVGLLVLVARLMRFSRLFSVGQRVPGTITSVTFTWKGIGWIVFSYEFGGMHMSNSNMVWKTDRTSALEKEITVTILIDPARPGRSVVLDLYT
jgi:hypothetical protein